MISLVTGFPPYINVSSDVAWFDEAFVWQHLEVPRPRLLWPLQVPFRLFVGLFSYVCVSFDVAQSDKTLAAVENAKSEAARASLF